MKSSVLRKISWDKYFLLAIGALYAVVFAVNRGLFQESLFFSGKVLIKILPAFIFVFLLMFVINMYVTRQAVLKYLGREGWLKWVFAMLGGVVSTGPIYAWYPLLGELKDKGMSYGAVTCFLYNRPVKLPLLPVFVVYFGLPFVAVLTLVMMATSIIQGKIMDKLI